jgi:MFS transporter, DHA1 family, inner membrane transport protein
MMTVPVAANPAANRADGRLFVLALGMFAMGTGSFVVAGILPDVARTLGTSPSAAGLMVTVNALAFAVMAPIVAALAGGWPRKTLLVAALAIFVLGNAISALGTNLATVLIGRAVTGLGAAMFSPTALGIAATIVAPERRGRALAIVTAGLAGSTALGAPLGTLIGGLVGWRATLWFVAGIGFMTALGVGLLLRAVPQPPRIGLAARLAPLRHAGIGLTMLTTLFAFGGFLMVYTYSGLVFDRVTGGEKSLLAGLLLFWGVAAIIGNLVSGRLVDRHGSHRIIIGTLAVAIGNILWGAAGWGLMVPQQHRLISASPEQAPLLLALNNSALHAGLVLASLAGAGALLVIDRHYLGWAGAASLAIALLLARAARTHLDRRSAATDGEAPQVLAPAE